jgi:chitinase
MGVEVPPEAWGGHVLTLSEVAQIADYLKAHGGNGMMLWSLQKPGSPSPAAISTVICNKFSLGACTTPL